jgi:hypothetical protein
VFDVGVVAPVDGVEGVVGVVGWTNAGFTATAPPVLAGMVDVAGVSQLEMQYTPPHSNLRV